MNINITKSADYDLENIFFYSIEQFGFEQAETYYQGLKQQFDKIVHGLAASRDYGFVKKEVRRTNYGSHAIYYRIKGETIIILRVLHQGMEPTRYLYPPLL